MVAVPFIALSPAQTLAIITLFFSFLVCTILFFYYCHDLKGNKCKGSRNCCKSLGKLLVAVVFYFGVMIFLIFMVEYFNELVKNGLTPSGLGSVILAFTPSAIIFFLTLKFKSLSVMNAADATVNAADATVNTDNRTCEASGGNVERNVSENLTENSPLLINRGV